MSQTMNTTLLTLSLLLVACGGDPTLTDDGTTGEDVAARCQALADGGHVERVLWAPRQAICLVWCEPGYYECQEGVCAQANTDQNCGGCGRTCGQTQSCQLIPASRSVHPPYVETAPASWACRPLP